MQTNHRFLYLLAILKFILPFLLQHNIYQPHRDEFLYLAEGDHLAWGYMEVPPLLSLFAWLTNQFGASMFWIKCWPALFGSLTYLLVGKMILSLGGKKFALLLGWLPFVLGSYMRLFFLFQPNFLDSFFWTAIAYSLLRFIQTKENRWLYWMGISLGLGMMSKYSVVFYGVSIFLGLLLTQHRMLFANRHFYLSMLVAFIIVLPNLVWQHQHMYPVITHMKELQEQQLRYLNWTGFISSQLRMNLACLFIWLAGLYYLLVTAAGKPYRVFAWAFLSVMILLILLRGKSYYALGSYPVLFAFGAVYLEKIAVGSVAWTRYAMVALALTVGFFLMPLLMPLYPPEKLANYYKSTGLNKLGSFKWEDQRYHPLPQDFADMIGWREIVLKTAGVMDSIPAEERDNTLILCDGYYTAGAMNYYGKQLGLPVAISDGASFLFWMPSEYNIKNLIFIHHSLPPMDEGFFSHFKSAEIRDSVYIPFFRENGMKVILFTHADDSASIIAEKEVRLMKRKYLR